MKTVIKKIDTDWFEMILSGKKKFELRLADFNIEDGDILRLEEYIPDTELGRKPTGRYIERKVTYVQKINLEEWAEHQPEIMEKGFYVLQFD